MGINKLQVIGIVVLVILAVGIGSFKIVHIAGNELGVRETFNGGVQADPLQPKTYVFFRLTNTIYIYDMAPKVYVMNDKPSSEEEAEGRERDSYLVQSKDQQDMVIASNLRWRINPEKVVEFHKNIRSNVEEKLIRPDMLRIVKNHATQRTAIQAYSGEGLVKLQEDIFKNLREDLEKYLIVDSYAIEHIGLNQQYVKQITNRQIAIQEKLAADEQTKAAEAKALRAKAEAMAELNKRVVEAERDKKVGILRAEQLAREAVLAAEADNQKVVLQAQAAKQRTVLGAEAEKEAGEMKAAAILAIGKATAEAKKLELSAYAVPGAENWVQVEVSKSLAKGFGNIKGYLPGDMKINLLTTSFMDSVKQIIANPAHGK